MYLDLFYFNSTTHNTVIWANKVERFAAHRARLISKPCQRIVVLTVNLEIKRPSFLEIDRFFHMTLSSSWALLGHIMLLFEILTCTRPSTFILSVSNIVNFEFTGQTGVNTF